MLVIPTNWFAFTYLCLRSAFWQVSVYIHHRRCSSGRVENRSTGASRGRWWQFDPPEGLLHPCGGWTAGWCDLPQRHHPHWAAGVCYNYHSITLNLYRISVMSATNDAIHIHVLVFLDATLSLQSRMLIGGDSLVYCSHYTITILK